LVAACSDVVGVCCWAFVEQICGRNFSTPDKLRQELHGASGVDYIHEDRQYAAYSDRASYIVWTFTNPPHPAHPAVICRKAVQRGEEIGVELSSRCGGPKSACDKMVEEFNQMMPNIRRDIQQRGNEKRPAL
jgi:hypothetical protein